MNQIETKLESVRLQLLASQEKTKGKKELEILRHKNVMEELEFMKKNKITSYVFSRGAEK